METVTRYCHECVCWLTQVGRFGWCVRYDQYRLITEDVCDTPKFPKGNWGYESDSEE